jgi:antitoxin component YwqK of YwqJK toxin-antitoxin module
VQQASIAHGRRLARASVLIVACFPSACARQSLHYSDGTLRAEGRISWPDRREQGYWSYCYPNGAVREQGRFEDGHRVGVWEQWFPNGALRTRGLRRYHPEIGSSEREGLWRQWHENGMIAATGSYRAGKREGHWDFTHPDGGLDGDRTGEYHEDVKID